MLALRIPVFIDPNGTPYKLKPVDANRVGGHVKATLGAFEGRSVHTDVAVGPAGFAGKKATWWIPGPRSAAEMLEWVRKNDGTVALDGSSHIKTPYLFESSDKKLATICSQLTDSKFGAAYEAIESALAAGASSSSAAHTMVPMRILFIVEAPSAGKLPRRIAMVCPDGRGGLFQRRAGRRPCCRTG